MENPTPPPKPDLSYRISEADRAGLPLDIDVDALETLLQHSPPSHRPSLLLSFGQRDSEGGRIIGEPYDSPAPVLTRSSDPVMNEMIGRVWAKRWIKCTLQELEAMSDAVPGVSAAREAARMRPKAP